MARERRRRRRPRSASSAIGVVRASLVACAPALLVAQALVFSGCTDGVTPDCSGAAAAACGPAGDGDAAADGAADSGPSLPEASADAAADAGDGSDAGLDGGDAG
jgi:hypothetical protein